MNEYNYLKNHYLTNSISIFVSVDLLYHANAACPKIDMLDN